MFSIQCPNCNSWYSAQRPPKVIPCGHSICSLCILDMVQTRGCYQCTSVFYSGRLCVMTFQSVNVNYPPPTNFLFFEAIERMDKYIKQKCWELGSMRQKDEIVEDKVRLKIEQECLYTFCQRRKFERDGVSQLYCSQECKRNHEELQSII